LDPILGTRAAVRAPFISESSPPETPNDPLTETTGNLFFPDEYDLQQIVADTALDEVRLPPDSISSAASAFRKSLETKEVPKKHLAKTGQDRIASAYERRAEVEYNKLEIMREELKLKEGVENRKLALEKSKIELQRHEIQTKESREYQDSTNKHKLEVAKLTNDPE
jgi:hypothetical protein